MSAQERGVELKVGLFILTGLVFIGSMIMTFGRIGQGLNEFYSLNVKLPDASGILKGSDVLLAGARIGHVADKPQIARDVSSVAVKLNILKEVKIPKDARFQVGSSGLLGDRFVEVLTGATFKPGQFNPDDPEQVLQEGQTIQGTRAGGLQDVIDQGKPLIDDLRGAIAEIKVATTNLNEEILSKGNTEALQATLANLKTTSATFSEASANLNVVIQNAGGTVEVAKKTMTTADGAAADLRLAIADLRKAVDSAHQVVRQASQGDGMLPMLLTDEKAAEDLKALIANLRNHGILFYKNRARAGESSPPEPAKPKRR